MSSRGNKGDLRSSEAAGSGDPRRARASVPNLRNPPSADSTACGSTASTFPACIWETSASGNDSRNRKQRWIQSRAICQTLTEKSGGRRPKGHGRILRPRSQPVLGAPPMARNRPSGEKHIDKMAASSITVNSDNRDLLSGLHSVSKALPAASWRPVAIRRPSREIATTAPWCGNCVEYCRFSTRPDGYSITAMGVWIVLPEGENTQPDAGRFES